MRDLLEIICLAFIQKSTTERNNAQLKKIQQSISTGIILKKIYKQPINTEKDSHYISH
jgi:hypothetical protein